MKVLFVMRHSGYVRNFESTLRMLCERGHRVHLAFQIDGPHRLLDAHDVAQQLANQFERFSRGTIPTREDSWAYLARDVRATLDYLRYLGPQYSDAPKLRARAERDVPAANLRRLQRGVFSTPAGTAVFRRWLGASYRAIPSDVSIDAYLEAWKPDILVLTPLIEPGAPQAEYVRSARALGIRTVLCVASWDNLTNKGLIHGRVDMVTVWNETMKQEAVSLHGIPPDRVTVTGAQPFDHWFDWRPRTSRQEFARAVGLPAEQPHILYVCSSKFVAPDEVTFVRDWLSHLRQSASSTLRDTPVLIRPHPQNAEQWRNASVDEIGPVAIWPPAGAAPADDDSRAEYFDSIYHSCAVVGVNTTAEIESAIVGRPVFTLLAPEFRDTQEGTLHFHHLAHVNGGLVTVARDFTEHLAQLDGAVREVGRHTEQCRRFVDAFVRPFGFDQPATPRLVAALESLAARPAPMPEAAPLWAPLVRAAIAAKAGQLQREARRIIEEKAAKQATKKRSAPPERPSQPAKVRRSWKDLVPIYEALDSRERLRFGRATLGLMPGELLLEAAPAERLDYPDADIVLRVTSKEERNRLKACAKEPFTIDWLHQWVGRDEVLFDIGANVGAYSLVAVKKPGGSARVFAFEPSYANVASLCANIVLNEAAHRITPLPVALSDRTGMSVFGLRALQAGSARHILGGGPSPEGPTLYEQPVMTFRLDDLIERFGLPTPNHIKLDVDGGELAVLDGAAKALASSSLRSMLVEVSTSLSEVITEALSGRGLRLQSKVNVKNKAGEYLVWYGLFIREPQHDSREPRDVQVFHVAR